MTLNLNKWCKHCQKTNHNTNECWSTHAVDTYAEDPKLPADAYGGWLGVMKRSLAAHDKVERNAGPALPDGGQKNG